MISPTTNRYRPAQRRLHWLTAVLIVAAYAAIEFRGGFERGSLARTLMVQSHFWLGLTVLALLLPRLLQRVRHRAPPVSPALPRWQSLPAGVLHLALYVFLVAQPLLGLATAWADGKDVLLPFTGTALPALVAPDAALAQSLEDLHVAIGTAFYWVIGLHVLAALYHHFVRRDDTLRRM